MIRIYIFLFVISFIGAAVYGAKYYYDSTQETIRYLSAENATLNSAYEAQVATLNAMQQQAEKQNQLNAELSKNLQDANSGLNEIRQKLSNHDLTKLAIAKPGLIETRINNGTKNVFAQIEEDTSNKSNPNLESAE